MICPFKVDILDAQFERLQESQAAAVEQRDHDPGHALYVRQHGGHLGSGQDDGKPLRGRCADDPADLTKVDAEHLSLEEQHGGQGLVLRGGTDVPVGSERAEIGGKVLGGQIEALADS